MKTGKPLGGRGSATNPAGELTALPQIQLVGGGCCSSPGTSPPLLALRSCPQWKFLGMPLRGLNSIQRVDRRS